MTYILLAEISIIALTIAASYVLIQPSPVLVPVKIRQKKGK